MADSAACSFRVKIPPPFLNLQLTAEAQSALYVTFILSVPFPSLKLISAYVLFCPMFPNVVWILRPWSYCLVLRAIHRSMILFAMPCLPPPAVLKLKILN